MRIKVTQSGVGALAPVAKMINFEEEINRFQPAPELDDAEKIIHENVMADIRDIIIEAQALKAGKSAETETKEE